MESLSYACEGRALLFTDDTDYQVDSLVRKRNMLKKWDGEDAVENMGFMEPLLPNTLKNSFHSNQCLETSGDGTDDHSSKSLQSASTITLNSLMEFGKRFSGYVNKANDEKFATPRECNGNPLSMDNSALSSPEPSITAKRQRITNLQSTVPTCQVYGCNKDLSSSKDYHKRHKVCNAHSKTPVVIVNGIQQRFCQQCSRFHILAEFDEGKRSCRKRLAGHNERRRKPQFDTHLGSTYFTDVSKTSLLFSRILPSGFFGQQYNEPTNHSGILKSEEEPSQLSVLHFHGVEKQYPSKNCLNPPLSLQEFSWGSNSSCVLSLLSAQSQNLSSNSEGISVAPNLFTLQNSATPLGETVGSEIPETGFSQDPNNVMLKSSLSHEGTNTVDLLELSLHLQRVEQQKYFGQVKLENGVFCDSMIARK